MKLSFTIISFAVLVTLTSAAPIGRTTTCERVDIRRNIADLTTAQRDTFFNAIQKLKDTPDPNVRDLSIYDKFVKTHVDYSAEGHGNAQFLLWHRVFLREFELELQKVEPSVVLPFWDWSISSQAPERSIVFTQDYLGGTGNGNSKCVTSGRFANWQTQYPSKGCLQRSFDGGNKIGAFTAPELLDEMIYKTNSYDDFATKLEYGIHGRVHNGIGGTMGQMGSNSDPIFYLHHANVDRLWSMYQSRGDKQGFEYSGKQPENRGDASLDDILIPFNMTVRVAMDMVNNLCYTYTKRDIPTPVAEPTPTPTVTVVTPTPTPATPTPAIPTPATPTPAVPTPAVPTPAVPTPAVPTPAVPTPAVPTTAVPTPAVPTTAVPTPAVPTPAVPTPAVPTPAIPTPAVPTPAIPTPAVPTPTVPTSTPAIPTPAIPTSVVPTPALPTSVVPVPTSTPAIPTPATPTPATTPQISAETPVSETPTPGATPITTTTPVPTAGPTTQPTPTSQATPVPTPDMVDAYDRSNMDKIRMPVPVPTFWLAMNGLSIDRYTSEEAILAENVKKHNALPINSIASLRFYTDEPTCDIISDKVYEAYGLPVPSADTIHLTAPIGKVSFLTAQGVTAPDGGSHVNPQNLPVADPPTSSAPSSASGIPLALVLAAAVLFHF